MESFNLLCKFFLKKKHLYKDILRFYPFFKKQSFDEVMQCYQWTFQNNWTVGGSLFLLPWAIYAILGWKGFPIAWINVNGGNRCWNFMEPIWTMLCTDWKSGLKPHLLWLRWVHFVYFLNIAGEAVALNPAWFVPSFLFAGILHCGVRNDCDPALALLSRRPRIPISCWLLMSCLIFVLGVALNS